MNITVVDSEGRISCRPDTTRKREGLDLYVPEEVESLAWTPVMFAMVNRACKCVGERFAPRYWDAVCFGVLLYAEGHPSAPFFNCTSILPEAMYSKVTLEPADNEFVLSSDSGELFRTLTPGNAAGRMDKAVAEVTKIVFQRTGDLIAIELAPVRHLCSRDIGETALRATWCGNPLFDFRIIF